MSTLPIAHVPDEAIEHPGILVNNYRLVESLRSALSGGQHAFELVPDVVEEILEEKAWMDRLDRAGGRQRYEHDDDFEDFVTDPPPRGLGTTKDEIRKYLGDSDNPLRVEFEKAAEKGPGNRIGRQDAPRTPTGSFTSNPNVIRNTGVPGPSPPIIRIHDQPAPPAPKRDRSKEPQAGTSVGYAIRRLNRDRPELLERVKQGELTAHKAMVVAGFLPPTITIPIDPEVAARRIVKHFQGADLEALVCGLADRIGCDLVRRDGEVVGAVPAGTTPVT